MTPPANGEPVPIQLGHNVNTGMVVMRFAKDICEIVFTAEQAASLGKELIGQAKLANGRPN
jgi:hypothetical protein